MQQRQLIPLELQSLPQWVCAGINKMPLNPRTGKMASVTDASTWGTFEEANRSGYTHIGFVLTTEDPYTIIDLDATEDPDALQRQDKIVSMLASYTEISQSGKGRHVIVRGSIPRGARRDKVEMYSSHRYMICTGNVCVNAPIEERQELLDILFREMSPVGDASTDLEDHEDARFTDDQIIDRAMHAVNGDKFNALCRGEWQREGYPSQSEADFALLSMFAFYTPHNEQVRRLFRMSALGKRDKAQRDKYLNTALAKIRAKEAPPVDLAQFEDAPVEQHEPAGELPSVPTKPPASNIPPPPGLIGELADYIFSAAVRPVREVGLAAALALTAGIVGRSYNISNTGLNQYVILLARTGSGKEGAASGIESLITALRSGVPMVDRFIGPSAFASGQALIRVLEERPCFVSVLGEFGLTLQQLCDPRANAALIMLRRVMLDLYTKSGWSNMLRPWVYSDNTKNTGTIQAPGVTILGEATPETFYHGLDSTHIAEGLIPRFSVIEYTGGRPARNANAFTPPPGALVSKLEQLVVTALHTQNNNTCAPVQCDTLAGRMLDELDVYADSRINGSGQDVEMQLWNRAHLKALKLAALLAVGSNPHQPVIRQEEALWAVEFTKRDIDQVLLRFAGGDVGTGDHRKEADIRRAMEQYFELKAGARLQYKAPKTLVTAPGSANVVPFAYLKERTRTLTSFKQDRLGSNKALKQVLEDMTASGVLILVPPTQAREKFGVSTALYIKGEAW